MAMESISVPPDNTQIKCRAACDECRSKKLKCSGDRPTCSRCLREKIACTYSPQKQMGRPKKRQREDGPGGEEGVIDDRSLGHMITPAAIPQGMAPPGDAVSYNSDTLPDIENGVLNTSFSSGGILQPWTVLDDFDWTGLGHGQEAFDSSGPGLTRDNSSEKSLPTHNNTLEVPNNPYLIHEPSHSPLNTLNTGIPAADQMPTCACLSTLYLTLSNLTTMDPSFSFPTALHPLREAMSVASQVIACPTCPARFITGLQNVQLLNALLMSLAERFSRVLTSISNEADDLVRHNATAGPGEQKSKSFRMADLSTPGHLHTGGVGCAAAFSLSFTPAEWRGMAKKVVRAEVYGSQDGNTCCPCLLGLITDMEKRQDRWHQAHPSHDVPRDADGNIALRPPVVDARLGMGVSDENDHERTKVDGEHLCLKMLAGTRRMIDAFDWD